MKQTRRIGNNIVAVDSAADLQPQAAALLDKLATLHAKGPPLRDGSTIDFGWSRLTLRAEGPELIVHEPDFLGDPLHRTVPQVNETLGVSLAQASLLRRLRVDGLDARWDSFIAMQRGILNQPRVYLKRSPSDQRDFSGWYLGAVEGDAKVEVNDLERIRVFQLYKNRPELLEVLALPAGWIVVFNSRVIEAILDPAGQTHPVSP
jgi:hypothetical protein